MLSWGAEGPRFVSRPGRIFFTSISFKRGNEPNGEEQQEQVVAPGLARGLRHGF